MVGRARACLASDHAAAMTVGVLCVGGGYRILVKHKQLGLGEPDMSFTGSSLSAEVVRSYLQSKKDEEAAKQQALKASINVELDKLRAAFNQREVQPDALDRIALLVQRTIDMGDKQALVLRFPSEWLSDQGRAITNHDKNWYENLDGFAKRAYDFFRKELEPRGFQIRAAILDWPGGMPGDVGFFLQWKHPDEALE